MAYLRPSRPDRRAFTLIELLVVVSIIAVLAALLIPGIGLARDAVRKSRTKVLIDGLVGAMDIYKLEDGRGRYPLCVNQSLCTGTPAAPGPLDLLRDRGAGWRHDDLDTGPASTVPNRLVDAWRRPIRYVLDDVMDKARPATVPDLDNWNPQDREPFAYVWSLGKPKGDEAADAALTNVDNWLFHGSTR